MKVKSESEVAQLCLTLSDLMDCSLPGSSVHGIFQARVLERGAIASPIDMHSPLYNKSILQMITYGCENSVFQRYGLNLLVVTLLPREEDHSTSPRNCLQFLQVRFIRKKA